MKSYRVEGIILQAFNFQDYDKILTIFSLEEGLIKLIFKGANNPKRSKGTITSPLTRAEFIFVKSKGEIHKCREISIINQYPRLRESLDNLHAACEMIQTVQSSQISQTPAPDLYNLLLAYLEKIPIIANPEILTTSFRLKVLRYEGLLGFDPNCSTCSSPLHTQYSCGGESFCKKHAPSDSIVFFEEEAQLAMYLATCRSYSQLASTTLNSGITSKVKSLFEGQMKG
jgi:DNA repair protein RecO (recombination protein O)